MTMPFRLAVAAVIGVLVIGGAFLPDQTAQPSVGPPGPTPSASPAAAASPTGASRWLVTGAPSEDRGNDMTKTDLLDGRVLVAAGESASGSASGTAELYDPATESWTATGSLGLARPIRRPRGSPTGRCLIAGGANAGVRRASAELYDPASGTWTPTGDMTEPRCAGTSRPAARWAGAVGGGNEDDIHGTAELYDPSHRYVGGDRPMTAWRAGPSSAVVLTDGRVLVSGGFVPSWTSSRRSSTIRRRGTLKATGPMTATASDDQIGGRCCAMARCWSPAGPPTSADCTTRRPERGLQRARWSRRYADLIVLITMPDGTVLSVAGGGSRGGDRATLEQLRPGDRVWTDLGPLAARRSSSVRRRCCRMGGCSSSSSTTTAPGGHSGAEIYQP